jgi:predicted Rossmann-fold nucleotide-binding protein
VQHPELETLEEVRAFAAANGSLANVVVQSLDLTGMDEMLAGLDLDDAIFLGCNLGPLLHNAAGRKGALIFPRLDGVPFNPYRASLYSPEDLMGGYVPGEAETYAETLDARVYQHFLDTGRAEPPSLRETLARRLHDHAITDALHEVIEGKHIVAIMGGHGMPRTAPDYARVARISRALTREGVLMISGGGPGAMEATHLGAWLAPYDDADLDAALELLAAAPGYAPIPAWLDAAYAVRERFPAKRGAPDSVGIPTWLYGHEPPTVFASKIAKYFANSVREDGLLHIARGGVVFAPGSAGTIQEIFQDACQNHYVTAGVTSPMIFLGTAYWSWTKPVFPVLAQLAAGRPYASQLHLTDDEHDVVQRLLAARGEDA